MEWTDGMEYQLTKIAISPFHRLDTPKAECVTKITRRLWTAELVASFPGSLKTDYRIEQCVSTLVLSFHPDSSLSSPLEGSENQTTSGLWT